ncbi:MAG: amidohydrolase family protein [Nitrospira sp.]|nr:amidohydrolase family protein [bacterium]MBL7049589.1 amidohydrolase family protein [Nitrospira sp.]
MVLADGRAEGKLCQGVTTEINGNCGLSAAPLLGPALQQRDQELNALGITERWATFEEYFSLVEKSRISLNLYTLAGHGNIRACVSGFQDRELTKDEVRLAAGLLEEALKQGAGGLSTGLIYPPGIYSSTDEIIALAAIAGRYGTVYTSHMRSEGAQLVESVKEVLRIGKEAQVNVHISHLKTSGEKNWNKLANVMQMIDDACHMGMKVTCDRYPYTASATDLDSILPGWVFEGGKSGELKTIEEHKQRIKAELTQEYLDPAYWGQIMISSVRTEKNSWMLGKRVSEIASIVQIDPSDLVLNLLLQEELDVGAIFFTMSDKNLETILKKKYTAIGSDSSARSFDGVTAAGMPHPRGFGSFPRVLGEFVRERGVLSLSEAVYKMTGLPASIFGLKDRGRLAKGFFADITVFFPDTIADRAEYCDPFKKPDGISHVFVNGMPAIRDGLVTGFMTGRVLRR